MRQPAGRAGPDPGGLVPGAAARSLVYGVWRIEGWESAVGGVACGGVAQRERRGSRARSDYVLRRHGTPAARGWKAGLLGGMGEGIRRSGAATGSTS
jgi:hypothetical protein